MSAVVVSCTKCNTALPVDVFNSEALFPCPTCGATLQADIFPALFRPIATGKAGEVTMEETEASCFYHPEKKAVLPCDACGRFMCALCDCDLSGQHICPSCLEAGRTKGKIKSLENKRVLYDDMALGLAILSFVPPIVPYFCWITAPLAIFISIRYWKSPGSMVRRTKIRFVFAILIALLAIMMIVGIILLIVKDVRRHR